jgi:hypothetical protein
MPGIVRVKTWVPREVLVYSDLNDEFDNIINNLEASNVDGYSSTVAQMQETTDPGTVGSESLALTISDEIERLRFAISRIIGKTYWYETPSRSLQTTFVDADLYLQASPYLGNLSIQEATQESILAGYYDADGFDDLNWIDSVNKKMPDTAFAFKNDPADPRYFYMDMSKTSASSATLSFFFRNFSSNDTIYFNPLTGLRLYLNANGYIKLDQETSDSITNGTKISYSIVGTVSLAGLSTFTNVIVRYRYGNVGTDQVDLLVNGVLVGSISGNALPINQPTAPAAKAVIFGSRTPNAPLYSLTFPSGNLPAANGWTRTNTAGGSESAAAGILTIGAAAASDTNFYTRSSATASFPSGSLPTNGQFIEMKFKFGNNVASTDGVSVGAPFGFYLHNATTGVGVVCRITPDEIFFNRPGTTTDLPLNTDGPLLSVAHNFTQWTHIFFVMRPTITYVFINGEIKGSFVTPADTTANNEIKFGKVTTSNVAPTIQIEYVYVGNVAGSNPDYYSENVTNVQQISDPCVMRGFITDSATIAALQTSSPFSLFGKSERKSCNVSSRAFWLATSVPTATSSLIGAVANFTSDGITPTSICCQIFSRPQASTAGAYHLVGYLKIARAFDGQAQHVSGLISNTASAITATGNLQSSVYINNTTGHEFQAEMNITNSIVLPAGFYTVSAVYSNLSTPATMIVNRVICSVAN